MTRFARDYSCFDQDNFLADVESIQWDNVFRESDINQMFDSFYSVVNTTIDKHAPLKKFSKRGTKFLVQTLKLLRVLIYLLKHKIS